MSEGQLLVCTSRLTITRRAEEITVQGWRERVDKLPLNPSTPLADLSYHDAPATALVAVI